MSVRAHRVLVPAKVATSASFNLWHDEEITDELYALENTYQYLDETGGGRIEINREELQNWLNTTKVELDEQTRKQFQNDIDETAGQDYIEYECY